mmetsp:Transcript_26274/g.69080  ORF Transcript_26274/g.69080 Transcript_26274/m.69080 type:complete len:297 (-) Transcript_26274:685-1575(-)
MEVVDRQCLAHDRGTAQGSFHEPRPLPHRRNHFKPLVPLGIFHIFETLEQRERVLGICVWRLPGQREDAHNLDRRQTPIQNKQKPFLAVLAQQLNHATWLLRHVLDLRLNLYQVHANCFAQRSQAWPLTSRRKIRGPSDRHGSCVDVRPSVRPLATLELPLGVHTVMQFLVHSLGHDVHDVAHKADRPRDEVRPHETGVGSLMLFIAQFGQLVFSTLGWHLRRGTGTCLFFACPLRPTYLRVQVGHSLARLSHARLFREELRTPRADHPNELTFSRSTIPAEVLQRKHFRLLRNVN